MLKKFKNYFYPDPHQAIKSQDEVQILYPQYRWKVLESTFIGYAVFYLVRNNLSTVAKDIEGALFYDHNMIGSILALSSISYGLGKFLMGSLSDRSNPRKFMAFGLLLTALCNFSFGSVANYNMHLFLWALNGFFQGMGWPPCGRSIGHWYSLKERGSIFAIWNISHNIGGGLAGMIAAYSVSQYLTWQAAFYIPGAIALVGSLYLFYRLVDTPQSVGLPPIEKYKSRESVAADGNKEVEKELETRDLFINYIFKNKVLWLIAFANFFVYIVRYSMLDWGPMYLREVKNATLSDGGLAILLIEFGGIPSTILMGWISDKFDGRRSMVSLWCMIPIFFAFLGIYLNPPGYLYFDLIMLIIIGFFIYPPVMLLGVAALDLTSKKAVGTAAGFVGLFGYIGRTVQAKGFGSLTNYLGQLYGYKYAWDMVIFLILGCIIASILLLALTWSVKPRR